MNETTESPYKSPSAELVDKGSIGSISQFKRFTAWGVFGLSIITLGIYPVYWLYTRAKTSNAIHDKPIGEAWLVGLVITTILSFASSFFGATEIGAMLGLVASLAYVVVYIVVLFALRNRLGDIMNQSSQMVYKIGPILTFFFGAIYLQYKINQCIDSQQGS